jgi:DNA-binding transcriptional regulator YdaS (Cro superfamily)
MTMLTIKDVARPAGGVIALSLALGLSRAAVSQWRRVPAERVVEVERLTGIPREQLRPDLYCTRAASAEGPQ